MPLFKRPAESVLSGLSCDYYPFFCSAVFYLPDGSLPLTKGINERECKEMFTKQVKNK